MPRAIERNPRRSYGPPRKFLTLLLETPRSLFLPIVRAERRSAPTGAGRQLGGAPRSRRPAGLVAGGGRSVPPLSLGTGRRQRRPQPTGASPRAPAPPIRAAGRRRRESRARSARGRGGRLPAPGSAAGSAAVPVPPSPPCRRSARPPGCCP